ncbi:MAG: ribonuclease P protein component [Caldimonas sp.]
MPRRQPEVEAMARLVESADFERVLGSRSRARTIHFSVHHLPTSDAAPAGPSGEPGSGELSTIEGRSGEAPVDDSFSEPLRRLGAVVPKRHARRAVTRSLLKRQIYAAGGRHAPALAHGLWIVRLRAPFERSRFVSAASTALRLAARAELEDLFRAASRPGTA